MKKTGNNGNMMAIYSSLRRLSIVSPHMIWMILPRREEAAKALQICFNYSRFLCVLRILLVGPKTKGKASFDRPQSLDKIAVSSGTCNL